MANCTVRWRSSGGRGEFEFVPADTLVDREISLFIESLELIIPAEVKGVRAQGKPRLRKYDKNSRKKLHLPQLVMAVARLPEPGREDLSPIVTFPLENKSFVMESMDFDIIDDDGINVTLAPLRVTILHSDFEINLQDRFTAIANDLAKIKEIKSSYPELAEAVDIHCKEISKSINSIDIRKTADKVIQLQTKIFGMTNAGSAAILEEAAAMPATDIEAELVGKEGKLLTRIHSYKERDRKFVLRAKKYYRDKNHGKLICEACDLDSIEFYGAGKDQCIEAHHKIPIEELQPDSITRVNEVQGKSIN